MKRFIVSVLSVSIFCVGIDAFVGHVNATFKSDEKALALIKQARLAIGGEQSIAEVRSMIIKGNTTHTFKLDTGLRTEQGETEIAMQLPDKLSKMVKIGRHEGVEGERMANHDVIIMNKEAGAVRELSGPGEKRIVIRKIDGGNGEVEKIITEGKDGEFTTSDGKKVFIRKTDGAEVEKVIVHGGDREKRVVLEGGAMRDHGAHRQNELLRTTLSLLLTAPEGMDVSYVFAGEGDVDGTTCNIINAEFGGSSFRLFLSKASSLPVMLSYIGHAMPRVMHFTMKTPEGAEPAKDKVFFNHKLPAPENAEIQVRFADYRSVNGVQLPYKWTTSVAGQTTEVFDVTGYEINPSNIAEKFQNQKVLVRTKKETN